MVSRLTVLGFVMVFPVNGFLIFVGEEVLGFFSFKKISFIDFVEKWFAIESVYGGSTRGQ